MEIIVFIIKVVVIAWTYTMVLTLPGHLLGPVKGWVTGWVNQHEWREYIMKPVILCPACVGGQIALWCWVFQEQTAPVLTLLFVVCSVISINHYGTKIAERIQV